MKIGIFENGKMTYRDATPEEEATFAAEHTEIPQCEPTAEERLAALEAAMLEVILNG